MAKSVDELMGISGVRRWGAASELARKSGVPRSRLSATKRGLSLKNAYAVAEAANCKTPISLYVLSQTKTLKSKLSAAEPGPGDSPGQAGYAAALAGAAAVLRELEKLDERELSAEASELNEALAELEKLIKQVAELAGGPGYPKSTNYPMNEMVKKSEDKPKPVERDAAGRRVNVGERKERDLFGRRM